MKNVLLDAIREVGRDEPGQTLSDSGSFETHDNEFGITANDEVADSSTGIDAVRLHETTIALALDESTTLDASADAHTASEKSAGVDSNATHRESPAAPPRMDTARRAPLIARLAPQICLLLAIVAAAGWATIQRLQGDLAANALDAAHPVTAATQRTTPVVTGHDKFRFLDSPLTGGQESGE